MASQSIRQARNGLRQLQREIRSELKTVGRTTIAHTQNEAQKRSSGPFSLRDLAKKDHPYAVRHGAPRLDPSMINTQSGAFRSDWSTSGPSFDGTGIAARLFNDNEVADFLQYGTRTMFRRPIGEWLGVWMANHAEKEVNAMVQRIERKWQKP